MKFKCFFLLASALTATDVVGVELVVATDRYYGVDLRGTIHVANLWDTETDAAAPGDMNPVYSRDGMTSAAMAPDQRFYYAECSDRVPITGGHEICVPRIVRVTITIAADGTVSHGPEEVVYRAPDPATVEDMIETWIRDIAIREIDDAGNYRVYFSTIGCLGCTLETYSIYYLDDFGMPQPYYTIPPGGIGVSSCAGLVDFWAGNFDFDDDGELYLSSGNHIPSGLFHVPEAGADSVTGTPVMIDENTCGGIQDFVFDAPDRVYMVENSLLPVVYERNPSTDVESAILEIPLSILDPPVGTAASIGVSDIDKMPPHIEWGDPPMVRGPPIARGSMPLPRARTEIPPRPPYRIVGKLIDRLPIPRPSAALATTPDLIMVGLEVGEPEIEAGRALIPFRAYLRNDGASIAKPFNIAIAVKNSGTSKPVRVKLQATCAMQRSSARIDRLGAGELVAWGGTLVLERPRGQELDKQSIEISADADSCRRGLFGFLRKKHCQIIESNEQNNRMVVDLQLAGRPPGN